MTMLKHFEKWASDSSLKNFLKNLWPLFMDRDAATKGGQSTFFTKSPGRAGD